MKTFIVTPDGWNGGTEWDQVVRALTPHDACIAVARYLQDDDITDFEQIEEGPPIEPSWIVREVPIIPFKHVGVVEWSMFAASFWRPLPVKSTQQT